MLSVTINAIVIRNAVKVFIVLPFLFNYKKSKGVKFYCLASWDFYKMYRVCRYQREKSKKFSSNWVSRNIKKVDLVTNNIVSATKC